MSDADICRRFSIAGWHTPRSVEVRRADADRLVKQGLLERRRTWRYEYRLTHKGYILRHNVVSEIF